MNAAAVFRGSSGIFLRAAGAAAAMKIHHPTLTSRILTTSIRFTTPNHYYSTSFLLRNSPPELPRTIACDFPLRESNARIPYDQRLQQRRSALFSTASASPSPSTGLVQKKPPLPNELKSGEDATKEEQVADMRILKTLAKYLWLKDNLEFRVRVMVAISLLVGAKVLNVQVPFLFKLAVDWLSASTPGGNLSEFAAANPVLLALFVTPSSVLLGYGMARVGASACNELRNAIFSKVALRAIRTVSKKVFSHLHNLDLGYHLSRQTGALNRIIDRGSRAINFILSAMVFNVIPTFLEVSWHTSLGHPLHG